MASTRALSRLSSRLQSLTINTNKRSLLSELSSPKLTRTSRISRLPVELSSMMPLHSAVASARLISSLSIDSQQWGLVPQGLSITYIFL
ncbi:hypothetical protein F8388_012900 [Cannabis sativa]|uniref:Uncharacterized protein n=1 Tax=Cannabis sativa TaxID=3483 RepID=A0A7J6EKC7_CANSA|nr:hypothetical protein G4B88_018145 [Cannabis sativa]KAF4361440.1 hypothetical protein F8388_012900 [Cannabis sativa]